MSLRSQRSPTYNNRYSREGFQPLNPADATINIPLDDVPHSSQHAQFAQSTEGDAMMEKEQARDPLRRSGKRRSMNNKATTGRVGYDGEPDTINRMGMFYDKLLHSSIIVRYMIYIIPLGICFAVPMIIGATAAQGATIGDVRIVWFFMWLLISWVGLWVSKLFAHYMPIIFQFFAGIISSGTRKYYLILRALEIQISLAGWALISLATFKPIMTRNPDTRHLSATDPTFTTPEWQNIVQQVLAAFLVGTLLFLGERLIIQLISINYHRKQFALKIRESKERVQQLTALYQSSRTMFPAFCPEFAEEDSIISDTIDLILSRKKPGHKRSGSNTPGRVLRDVGRIGDKLTSAFGNVAQEITGKQVFNPNSPHSIVVEALEKNRACDALARRLWLSFVVEGHEALYIEDIVEVFGEFRRTEAEECFAALDMDGNGDVSLDEMIQVVTEIGRERRAVANSMHDVDQAINVLDRMLCVIVLIAWIFVFIAFLNKSFVTTLATAGTTLLSLSFVFSVTAQEVLGSCIFLFVKHPLDIGDTIYLNGTSQSTTPDQLICEKVSLLYTVFKRVNSGRSVQIPNNVLNTLWVENITRSKAMREQLSIFVDFNTTFEDVQLLRQEMVNFVRAKDNQRDFQPNVEVEVIGIGNMDKLELRIEIQHKSNWANETVRASRRSRFMCALVLALRKVPIYAPGGGGPALGEMGNPTYSVALADAVAADKKAAAAKEKEAKRMVPSATDEKLSAQDSNATLSPSMSEHAEFASRVDNVKTSLNTNPNNPAPLATIQETRAMNLLTERNPAADVARDSGSFRADMPVAQAAESGDLLEVRGVLQRATTRGRRRSGTTTSNRAPITPLSSEPPVYNYPSPRGVRPAAATDHENERPSYERPSFTASGAIPNIPEDTRAASPYMYPSTSAPLYSTNSMAVQSSNTSNAPHPDYSGNSYPAPSAYSENIRPPPQVAVPAAGRQFSGADDLRGENEEEEPVGGLPKMTAGGAWSAQQWRSGM